MEWDGETWVFNGGGLVTTIRLKSDLTEQELKELIGG